MGRARVVTAAVTGLASLGWGSATLWDFAEEHASQVLPAHQLELVAAYPYSLAPTGEPGSMPAVVVDASGQPGDVIALGGEDWNVHRGDALSLSPTDVPRIRWIDAGEVVGISIRLEGEARAALDARSRSRSSQYDALYVDGEPLALVFYFGSEPGRLVLMDTDRAHLHQVYRRLTR
ncbi:MAG: hypothetical protein H6719_35500 [Sandaracinaceae bacterium]|nr:hypothetical protein [Sandaracinaceae bacterium]